MKISTIHFNKSCVDEASLALALKIARENILTELRNSELLEEKIVVQDANGSSFDLNNLAHNTLARAIKARLDELIKSNK